MEETYFNTKELAGYIKRSPQAIRDLVCRRAIPFQKPAGRLLFIKGEIDRWVRSGRSLSMDEIEHSGE